MAKKKTTKKAEDAKVLPIPMLGKELGRFEGETFYIAEHEYGVLYHVYNSMDLIIRPNMISGYETLVDLVRNKDVYEKLEGQEKEDFELNISAITYILSSPLFVFSDGKLMYDIASLIVEYLRKAYNAAMEAPLQEESVEEDRQFQESVIAMEEIKKSLEEE